VTEPTDLTEQADVTVPADLTEQADVTEPTDLTEQADVTVPADAPADQPDDEPADRTTDAPAVEALAPLGGPAEPEPPRHTLDPDATSEGRAVEDAVAYRLAVEDGAPLAATGGDPGAGEGAPEFRPPGGDAR
jgi:hypothetical protein